MKTPDSFLYQFKEPKEMFTYHFPGTFKDVMNLLRVHDEFDNLNLEYNFKVVHVEKSDRDRVYYVRFYRDTINPFLSEKSVKKLVGCCNHLEMFKSLIYGILNVFSDKEIPILDKIQVEIVSNELTFFDTLNVKDDMRVFLNTLKWFSKNKYMNKSLFLYFKEPHFEKVFYDGWSRENVEILCDDYAALNHETTCTKMLFKNSCPAVFETHDTVRKFLISYILKCFSFCVSCYKNVSFKIEKQIFEKSISKNDDSPYSISNDQIVNMLFLFAISNIFKMNDRGILRFTELNTYDRCFYGSETRMKKWLFDEKTFQLEMNYWKKRLFSNGVFEENKSLLPSSMLPANEKLMDYCEFFFSLLFLPDDDL